MSITELNMKYDFIDIFRQNSDFRYELTQNLKNCRDVERSFQRISVNQSSSGPRDLQDIQKTLSEVVIMAQRIKKFIKKNNIEFQLLNQILQSFDGFEQLQKKLSDALMDEVPIRSADGNMIKSSFSKELEKSREKVKLIENPKKLEEKYSLMLKRKLRIVKRKNFGYMIEVNIGDGQIEKEGFTLEKITDKKFYYLTEELLELKNRGELLISDCLELELKIYNELKADLFLFRDKLKLMCKAIGDLDVAVSFAQLSLDYNLCRPILSNEYN